MKQQSNHAAIYCRLSRDDGGDSESNSICNQRDILKRYALTNGFTIYNEYIEACDVIEPTKKSVFHSQLKKTGGGGDIGVQCSRK